MEPSHPSGAYFDKLGNVWGAGGQDDQSRLDAMTRFITDHLHDPAVVVECGPLHGETARRLLSAFPRTALHLVEIAPTYATALRERFSQDSRVTVHEADMLGLPTLPVPPADAVLLLECLYYLDQSERRAFVGGVERAHPAAKVIVASPVTGGVYFTERELRRLFAGYRLGGSEVVVADHKIYAFAPSRLRRRLRRDDVTSIVE